MTRRELIERLVGSPEELSQTLREIADNVDDRHANIRAVATAIAPLLEEDQRP